MYINKHGYTQIYVCVYGEVHICIISCLVRAHSELKPLDQSLLCTKLSSCLYTVCMWVYVCIYICVYKCIYTLVLSFVYLSV